MQRNRRASLRRRKKLSDSSVSFTFVCLTSCITCGPGWRGPGQAVIKAASLDSIIRLEIRAFVGSTGQESRQGGQPPTKAPLPGP